MEAIRRLVRAVDRAQQRHAVLAFPYAVVKKFGDDQGGSLASLIAYYGFFSMFPLLLVFVSVLGILLRGNPGLRHRLLESALRGFPVIGQAITSDVHAITAASPIGLAVGIAATLWAGLGLTQVAQDAMNRVWGIPQRDWPGFAPKRLRGVALLALLGTITVVSTVASGAGASLSSRALGLRVAGLAVSVVLNLLLFTLAYQLLTARRLRWRDVLPGAVAAGVAWTALQYGGGYYVSHQVAHARAVYGTFALVIGLLVWIHLGAQLTLYCAEINAVAHQRLWPRSLAPPPLTEGDRRAYRQVVYRAQIRPEQIVQVSYRDGAEAGAPAGDAAAGGEGGIRTREGLNTPTGLANRRHRPD